MLGAKPSCMNVWCSWVVSASIAVKKYYKKQCYLTHVCLMLVWSWHQWYKWFQGMLCQMAYKVCGHISTNLGPQKAQLMDLMYSFIL